MSYSKKDWQADLASGKFQEEFEKIRRMTQNELTDYIYQKAVDRAKERYQRTQDLRNA